MIDSLSHSEAALFDFEVVPVEAIALELDRVDRAVKLSSQSVNEARQWQTYLNALAVFGFEQWLSERAADIAVNQEHCSVWQPEYANVITAVCNLRVGEFKLCLIAAGTLSDEVVSLPRAAIDLPEYTAHFYVLLEVQEEQEQVTLRGFLHHNQLVARRQSVNLQAEPDWTYQLPLTWFDSDPDRLLLNLRCLEPAAIPLPAVPTNRLATLANRQTELAALLPQLQSSDRPLWQVLTWSQGTAVLTSPELLDWLYQMQTGNVAAYTSPLSDLLQLLTQKAVNVGCWLRGQLDEFAQSLYWEILPAFAPATMRRAPTEKIDTIVKQLKPTGMKIPPNARGIFKELDITQIPLQLYIFTWPLPSPEGIPEWTLLLLLGTQLGTDLPHGIKWRISNQKNIFVDRELEQNPHNSYLYARVVGTREDKFLVSISLNGEVQTLPPFCFCEE